MEAPKPVHVELTAIVLRDEWQVRADLNERTINQYVTALLHSEMPPIRLARVSGALMLVDGWHRLAAAKRLGRETILAVVEDMSEEEAAWAAAEANTMHGLPLKHKEKREVFRRYMKLGRNRAGRRKLKSYRDIARELHGIAGKSTLQRWMAEDFPRVADRMTTGLPAATGNKTVDKRTRYYEAAVAHLEQIVAAAPALGEEERQLLADQLADAAAKVLTAGPWEPRGLYKL